MKNKFSILNFVFLWLALSLLVIFFVLEDASPQIPQPSSNRESQFVPAADQKSLIPDSSFWMVEIPQLSPDFPIGLIGEDIGESFLLPTEIAFSEFFIEGYNGTLKVSWNEGKIDVFSVTLFDLELLHMNPIPPGANVWMISSLKDPDTTEGFIRKNLLGIIPSGYIIGDSIPDFSQSPKTSAEVQLAVGKEYDLTVTGFITKYGMDQPVIIKGVFTFTESCLPPNCQ